MNNGKMKYKAKYAKNRENTKTILKRNAYDNKNLLIGSWNNTS